MLPHPAHCLFCIRHSVPDIVHIGSHEMDILFFQIILTPACCRILPVTADGSVIHLDQCFQVNQFFYTLAFSKTAVSLCMSNYRSIPCSWQIPHCCTYLRIRYWRHRLNQYIITVCQRKQFSLFKQTYNTIRIKNLLSCPDSNWLSSPYLPIRTFHRAVCAAHQLIPKTSQLLRISVWKRFGIMWSCKHICDSLSSRHRKHMKTFFHRRRSIINSRQDMAMYINRL